MLPTRAVFNERLFSRKTLCHGAGLCRLARDHGGGCNQLARPDKADILRKLSAQVVFDPEYQPFGDGYSEEKIVDCIKAFFI